MEQAARYVPEMRRRGADVVVVSAHSGADTSSSYGDALPFPENAATLVAEQVPGIDAILVGHAHQEIVERVVTNTATGKPVVLSEPLKWGQRLSVFDIDLSFSRGRWTVQSVDASVLDASTVPEDPKIVDLLADEQQTVVDYVNGVIGTSTEAMSAATARYEDTAVLDFINYVQAGAVKAELTGADADLPVLSIAAPFNKDAAIPQATCPSGTSPACTSTTTRSRASSSRRAGQGVPGEVGGVLQAPRPLARTRPPTSPTR